MERQGRGRNIDRDQSFDLPRGKDHTEPTPVARNGGQLSRAKRIGSIGAKAVKAVPSRPKGKVFAKLPIPDLEGPTGLAIDGGTLYVADHSQGVVRGINLSKEQEIGRFGGLNRPHHLAAMSGSLLVTDTYNDRVICLNSELKEVWSTTSLDGHEFLRPHGVAANTPGEFYLADSNHNQLLRVENKTVKTVVGQDDAADEAASAVIFHNPCGVAVDENHVYVADTFNHRVVILSRDLQYVHRFGRIGSGFGEFSYPVGIAVRRQWLVVADEYNQRLQLWRLTKEEETTSATCLAEAFCANVLRSPFGIAFNTFGDLFIADRRAGAVWKVDFEQAVKAIPA
jgi:DNA-binding beta-propeller fold protein YncE